MKKKILIWVACLVALVSLAGCESNTRNKSTAASTSSHKAVKSSKFTAKESSVKKEARPEKKKVNIQDVVGKKTVSWAYLEVGDGYSPEVIHQISKESDSKQYLNNDTEPDFFQITLMPDGTYYSYFKYITAKFRDYFSTYQITQGKYRALSNGVQILKKGSVTYWYKSMVAPHKPTMEDVTAAEVDSDTDDTYVDDVLVFNDQLEIVKLASRSSKTYKIVDGVEKAENPALPVYNQKILVDAPAQFETLKQNYENRSH